MGLPSVFDVSCFVRKNINFCKIAFYPEARLIGVVGGREVLGRWMGCHQRQIILAVVRCSPYDFFPGSDSGGFLFSRDLPPGSESATRREGSEPPPSRLNWGLFVFFLFFCKSELVDIFKITSNWGQFWGVGG